VFNKVGGPFAGPPVNILRPASAGAGKRHFYGQFNTPVKKPWPFYIRQKIVLAKAEANVVVAIGGPVVVAISTTKVPGVVVPTAAAYHAIGTAAVPSL